MSDLQKDYRKIANKFGHYSDTRGMLAGMVIELADRIEALEAELKQMRKKVVHCNNCGDDWVDNGLVRVTCPHCELGQAKATIDRVRGLVEKWHETPDGYRDFPHYDQGHADGKDDAADELQAALESEDE